MTRCPACSGCQVVAEERVAMVEIAGASPKPYVQMMHDNGVKAAAAT